MKRSGRPKRASDVSSVLINFRLTLHEKEVLDDYCAVYQTNISEVMRSCLDVMCVVPNFK